MKIFILLCVVSSAGMILTLKDTGVPECTLSGPPQLVRDSVLQDKTMSAAGFFFLMYSLHICCLFFSIKEELSARHQVIFRTAGRHQAVYVEFTELDDFFARYQPV